MEELTPASLFNLAEDPSAPLFSNLTYVWEVLGKIKGYLKDTLRPNVQSLREHGEVLDRNCVLHHGEILRDNLVFETGDATKGEFKVFREGRLLEGASVIYAGTALMDDLIEIAPGAVIEPGALIKGPTYIGPNSEVRQGAYIRGSCYVGRSCVVGHVTEMKNSVMMDNAKAGHFAYLGDSVLGRDTNLGAGTKLANLKIVSKPIRIKCGDQVFSVDRRKFGAILGDHTETGCNTVTSPGTILARGCLVAPNMTVPSGYHPARSIIRQR